MFTKAKKTTPYDAVITTALTKLTTIEPTAPEYAAVLDQIVKLNKLKESESPSRVSRDVQATIAANLIGMLVVVHSEHVGVITTKAMSLVTKLR